MNENDINNEVEDIADAKKQDVPTIQALPLNELVKSVSIGDFETYEFQGREYVADMDDYQQQMDANDIQA